MTVDYIDFNKVNQIAFKDLVYIKTPEKLNEFFAFTPDLPGLTKAVNKRMEYPVNRTLLTEVLGRHYSKTGATPGQVSNIQALKDERTFTVVTAHQPCVLTGPAYYFYKIFSAIQLCKQLNEQLPEYHFVPVFISGSEDHDFEEVNHTSLFGQKLQWQTDQRGPVGRFSTDGLEELIKEFSELSGNRTYTGAIKDLLDECLLNAGTYNDFVFALLNRLFGKYGLVVLNMDDPDLKRAFIPIMKKEILERKSEKLVWETQEALLQHNFKPQAYPRDINLFYMQDQSRERIYFENGLYCINNTVLKYTEIEILDLLHHYPERFSPNVVLRPLYQEFILPNIAYIGGGGENAYWLERKNQFAYFNVFFPVIIRRNSALVITEGQLKQIKKTGLEWQDFMEEENKLITRYLEKSSDTNFHLNSETESVKHTFHEIATKAKSIDPTLEQYVLGEGAKLLKSIEHIESRLKKTLKQREETSIQQIYTVKHKLFPSNNLQERSESFFQFISMYGFELMDDFLPYFDPMQKEVLVFFV